MYIAIYRSFQQNMHELEPLLTDFEMLCSCRLTMHDHHHLLFNGSGERMVKKERFSHRKSFDACGYASRSYCVSRCMFQYNNHILRTRCRSCIKRCMYGNIEVAAPIFNGNTHIFSLFAGLWKHPVTSADHEKIMRLHNLLPAFAEGLLREAERIRCSTIQNVTTKGEIKNFIAANFNSDISTADLAKHLKLSISRTCHLVKEYFNTSFSELLTAERLSHAKLFLLHTDYRINEIAFMCGFSSVEHFNRMFKKKIGTSPGNFRKNG